MHIKPLNVILAATLSCSLLTPAAHSIEIDSSDKNQEITQPGNISLDTNSYNTTETSTEADPTEIVGNILIAGSSVGFIGATAHFVGNQVCSAMQNSLLPNPLPQLIPCHPPTPPAPIPVPEAKPAPAPQPAPHPAPTPAPQPAPRPAPVQNHTTNTNSYYRDCAAVRSAGKAPLYRGQPGYRPGLDRDGDGVACERD
ncbi:putative calcium-binding protein [Corynebacterium kutscheri]|uniref:Putative calcium-binding protein n=1 Tax=Corynebacterium kutscheri TaxID=35755 RepID=A0A0F6R316_9CORY|nr:excalibur calcium-binding domain-containing protein [Corynebacterium kutscheri]AKE41983.1 putative calcium-binding protein [Corynebacterium kutscheri]VEH10324.1 Metallo-beta-lactamase superfamily hydrolase [Corynebacterium kutscheri]